MYVIVVIVHVCQNSTDMSKIVQVCQSSTSKNRENHEACRSKKCILDIWRVSVAFSPPPAAQVKRVKQPLILQHSLAIKKIDSLGERVYCGAFYNPEALANR